MLEPNDDQTTFIQVKIAQNIDKYGAGALLIGGTIGNALSVCVLCRKRFRHGVATIFMLSLAVADMSSLLIGQGGRHWVRTLTGKDLSNDNDWHCKAWFHLTTWSLMSSSWILAALSVERCIAVLKPLQAKKLLTRRNSGVGLTVTVTALFAYTSQYSAIFEAKGWICVPDISNYYVREVRPWLDLILQSLAPGLLIVASNVLIVITLVRANRKRKKLQGRSASASNFSDDLRLKSTIPMLVSISVAFVVLMTPLQINWIVEQVFPATYTASLKEVANSRLIWTVLVFLVYLNSSINFLLYLVSGREFRHEAWAWVKEMLGCIQCTGKCHRKNEKDAELAK